MKTKIFLIVASLTAGLLSTPITAIAAEPEPILLIEETDPDAALGRYIRVCVTLHNVDPVSGGPGPGIRWCFHRTLKGVTCTSTGNGCQAVETDDGDLAIVRDGETVAIVPADQTVEALD